MNINQAISKLESGFESAQTHFEEEIKKLRTGRAHPSMLDGVMVEAYETKMPLKQVGSISTPEPQLLQITPFDTNNLDSVVSAIRNNQSLGMNPMDDGRVVRVPVPQLTEERRRDIVKVLNEKVEDSMISMRNTRQSVIKELDSAKKDKSISEDDFKRAQKEIDKLYQERKAKIEEIAKSKESDIMTI